MVRDPPDKPLVAPLTAGAINWLTTMSTDEVLWHPSRSEPLIEAPEWAPLVTFQRGSGPPLPVVFSLD